MGHLLDHAAHAGNIENTNIAIAELGAVLHQNLVAIMKLRLHALAADRDDLISFGNCMAVIENACFALGMILPIGAVACSRCASKILYAVHPLQRHAEIPLVNIAAHGFRKGLEVFFPTIVQRTVKVQKALLMLGQSAVPVLHAEELI